MPDEEAGGPAPVLRQDVQQATEVRFDPDGQLVPPRDFGGRLDIEDVVPVLDV
jgi:hypothetical protein